MTTRRIFRDVPAGRRWAYLGAALGAAVSIAANVAHSYVPPPRADDHWSPPAGSVVGAVFWPIILFVVIETFARNPAANGWWLALKVLGLVPVAIVAAVVSYSHMSGLLASFLIEDDFTIRFGPLAVDGLMVMATGMLIMTSPRPASKDEQHEAVPDGVEQPAPAAASAPTPAPTPVPVEPEPADDPVEPAAAPPVAPTPARRRTRTAPAGVPGRRRTTGGAPDPRRGEAAWRVVHGGESLRRVARDLVVSPSAVKNWADAGRAGKFEMVEPAESVPLHLVETAARS
jgi:hypothetical protein